METVWYYYDVSKMETQTKGDAEMTNTSKLKGRMAEQGYTLSSLSEELHISRPSLRKRINGTADFKVSEIENLCSVLKIPISEVGNYFFTHDVAKMETRG